MTSLRMALPLTFLFMVVGASGTEWSVKYNQQEICALEGSTVFMSGSYTLPERLTVRETFWVIDPDQGKDPTDLSKDPGYSGRVETLTDEQKHFSLRLSDVMKKDEHQYGFRIIADEGQRWLGTPGVQLRVTDLHLEAPGEVTEGGTAVLTCRTACSLTDPTFIWYKNGRPLTTKTNNQLHLQPVSSEDAGSYSCAVGGYQHLRSTDQTLRVRYSPKNVSVSISPPGGIVENSSVTLTCSSDANPPVKMYTWFKKSTSVGNGDTYNIPNIRSEHSGEYTCQGRNDLGEGRSTAVQINVQYPPKNVSVSTSPTGQTVEGSPVTLTCSSDANPPVEIYTWFKEGGSSPVGSGDSYSPLQSGSYYCKAENEHGAQRSDPVPVVVKEGYSVILYGAAGVGFCVVAVFLSVVFWWRRKKQARNMNEPDNVNEGHRTRCPDNSYGDVDSDENVAKADRSAPPCDNDSSGVNDYESITKGSLTDPPPDDDDSSSVGDYVNTPKAGLNTPPSDNGSSSADDYVNAPKAGLNAPPSDDDDSSNDYVNTPQAGLSSPPPDEDSSSDEEAYILV